MSMCVWMKYVAKIDKGHQRLPMEPNVTSGHQISFGVALDQWLTLVTSEVAMVAIGAHILQLVAIFVTDGISPNKAKEIKEI